MRASDWKPNLIGVSKPDSRTSCIVRRKDGSYRLAFWSLHNVWRHLVGGDPLEHEEVTHFMEIKEPNDG